MSSLFPWASGWSKMTLPASETFIAVSGHRWEDLLALAVVSARLRGEGEKGGEAYDYHRHYLLRSNLFMVYRSRISLGLRRSLECGERYTIKAKNS